MKRKDEYRVEMTITGRAWDQVCRYAEKYGMTTTEALQTVKIDYVPLKPPAAKAEAQPDLIPKEPKHGRR